jgi:hypothetical protein
MLYREPIDVSNRVKDIIKTVQSNKELDYATTTYYQKRLIAECDRLNKLMFNIPQPVQEELFGWIESIKGAIETLENRKPKISLYDNLATRLQNIGRDLNK